MHNSIKSLRKINKNCSSPMKIDNTSPRGKYKSWMRLTTRIQTCKSVKTSILSRLIYNLWPLKIYFEKTFYNLTKLALCLHGRINRLKIAKDSWKEKVLRKNPRLYMLKTDESHGTKLTCKTTKMKRTEYKAQKYTQVHKST